MFPAKDRIADAMRRRWPILLIIGAVTVLFWRFDAYSFLFVDTLAGRDLVGNYAFSHLMQAHLLEGVIIDWSNRWMLGFPAFALYPPLFFVAVGSINLVTAGLFGLQSVFLMVVFATVFLLPVLTYYAFRDHLPPREAFFIGFYTIYFLFVYPPVSHAYQTLAVGLVAQGFSLFLLVLLFRVLFRPGRRARLTAGVLLGATFLSHPFVGIIGGVAATAYAIIDRRPIRLVTPAVAGLISMPWLLNALQYLPYTNTYTLDPAVVGGFVFLLLPLILLGGVRTVLHRTLLATFLVTVVIAIVELPLITQAVRFFTYALLLGSILAGAGAYQISTYLAARYDWRVVAAILLVPVLGLSLHAGLSPMWAAEIETTPVTGMLSAQEPGRTLVESRADPLAETYVLQELIPIRTNHTVANELHLDSSSSANAILTLEYWISADPIQNPLCTTCNTTATPSRIGQRLDDLGIRYVLTTTKSARNRVSPVLQERDAAAGYTLYENPDARVVEPLSELPVALVGSNNRWRQVNKRLFTGNVTRPVVWLQQPPQHPDRFAAVVHMNDTSVDLVIQQIARSPRDPVPASDVQHTVVDDTVRITPSRAVPVHVRFSYFPTHTANRPLYPARFNTMIVYADRDTTITLT